VNLVPFSQLAYAIQSGRHARPARCRVRVGLARILLSRRPLGLPSFTAGSRQLFLVHKQARCHQRPYLAKTLM
jgi:hypothetical protein